MQTTSHVKELLELVLENDLSHPNKMPTIALINLIPFNCCIMADPESRPQSSTADTQL